MMNDNHVSWFFESAAERKNRPADPIPSFAPITVGTDKPFNQQFEALAESYMQAGIDIKKDIQPMITNRQFMEQYKEDLLKPVCDAFRNMSENDPHIESIIENVNKAWDTKVSKFTESASMPGFLPMSTLEFPVLVKQFFSSIQKDIIEVETVKSPNITKHIRTTYMVDNNTGEKYEYPKCLFTGEWQKIWDASKGTKIDETPVDFDSSTGGLYKYDIIANCTKGAGVSGSDALAYDFRIKAVKVGSEIVNLPGQGITVELSTGGTLVNGDLDFISPNGTQIQDEISGRVDFAKGTVSISSAKGTVTGVVFTGHLSNENNLRSASVQEERRLQQFKIEDGARWNMPFSIEEIEDAAALLDINYYNRMVDEIVRCQELNECMTTIKFLNDEFDKYNGTETDIWKLQPYVQTYEVDLKPPMNFAGDPFAYKSSVIQFRLKAAIQQVTDAIKMDNMSWVIVGNPMATQLISEFTKWKTEQGTSVGGIKVNGSYGFATDLGGANVRVVATNVYDAYTADTNKTTNKRELVLHVYGYPTSDDQISYKQLRYTSHLFTSQSQTAYQSPKATPGGAYNIVTAMSRFSNIAVQGIQFRLVLLNSEDVYGPAPKKALGAPWVA